MSTHSPDPRSGGAANPIVEGTAAVLAQLSDDELARVDKLVEDWAEQNLGDPISTAELLNLAKAVKVVASTDGFTARESEALAELLGAQGMPQSLVDHVTTFDIGTPSEQDIAELAPRGSRQARYLLLGALTVAARDGLSDSERRLADRLGEHLGVRRALVHAFIAEACLYALNRGEKALDTRLQLRALRRALLAMP